MSPERSHPPVVLRGTEQQLLPPEQLPAVIDGDALARPRMSALSPPRNGRLLVRATSLAKALSRVLSWPRAPPNLICWQFLGKRVRILLRAEEATRHAPY